MKLPVDARFRLQHVARARQDDVKVLAEFALRFRMETTMRALMKALMKAMMKAMMRVMMRAMMRAMASIMDMTVRMRVGGVVLWRQWAKRCDGGERGSARGESGQWRADLCYDGLTHSVDLGVHGRRNVSPRLT